MATADTIIEKKKLPLQTTNKINCLTACYEHGKAYIHPVTLEKMVDPNDNTCAIVPVPREQVSKESVSKEPNVFVRRGTCRMEDNKIYHVPSEVESMLLHFYFDPYEFLTQIYDLHTFNQVINWTLDNNTLPPDTIKRVHNATWKIFGSDLENISELVIDFYYDMAKNNWIKDFIPNISAKYSFDILAGANTDPNIGNVIVANFFPKNFFVQIIKKYISLYKDDWTEIDSHYKNLKNFTYKCIMKNIKYKIQDSRNFNQNVNLFKAKYK
jgi:hypothetical protein